MSLYLATPIYSGVPGPAHASAINLAIGYVASGGEMEFQSTWAVSNLPAARLALVKDAVRANKTHTLLTDDDIVYRPSDVAMLLALDVDVSAGVYHKKTIGGDAVGTPLPGASVTDGLLEMAAIGLGFTLVRTSVLARLLEAYGDSLFEFRYGTPAVTSGEEVSLTPRVIGEDEMFCTRWRELGGRIWLHTGVQLGHVGPHVFR